jgi:hypothetical protein
MSLFVPITMFGWPFLAIFMFAFWPKRRAMLLGLMISWLFLPQAGYLWPGPLKWTKVNAVSMGLLLAVAALDFRRLLSFRPRWFDIPVMVASIMPAVSSFANGLGIADAGTSSVNNILMYGVPYLLGRIYIIDLVGAFELADVWILGGLIYFPLCLFELRMSPMLHYDVYGFFPHQWAQMVRDGGYRPMVFMQHGLAVAMWMSACTVLAYGVWRMAGVKRHWHVPMWTWVLVLGIGTLICKSAGAIALTTIGCAAIEVGKRGPLRTILFVFALAAPVYIVARTSQTLTADRCMAGLHLVFSSDRVASASDRLHQEDVLSRRALESPIVGWGPWGDYLVSDQHDDLVQHSDSMWIITLGKYGMVGWGATVLIYLLPALRLIWPMRRANVSPLQQRVSQVLALISVLAMLDSLSNFMPNPFFVLAAGAVATLTEANRKTTVPLSRQERFVAKRQDAAGAPRKPVYTHRSNNRISTRPSDLPKP